MNVLADPLAGLSDVLPAIAADAATHDVRGSVPHDGLARLRQAGLLGLTVPAALGGRGAGLREATRAVEAVGAACPATALIFAMHLLRHAAIARSPTWPAPLRTLLGREAVEHGSLINALRVEPELGSPTRGGLPATTARRTETGWAISGHKRYATGFEALAWLEVHARTEDAAPRVGSFLVPADAPGIRVVPAWNHLGLRGSGSHDVIFDDVTIPAGHVIGLGAPGATAPEPEQMAWNGILVPAVYTGIARAALRWTVHFLQHRTPSNLGAPLATLPRVEEAIGGIVALLSANARITEAVAAAVDAGATPPGAESGALKTVLVENAVRAVEACTLLAGNHAHDRAHPLERHWRDVQCGRMHAPAIDAAHRAAGRAALQASVP